MQTLLASHRFQKGEFERKERDEREGRSKGSTRKIKWNSESGVSSEARFEKSHALVSYRFFACFPDRQSTGQVRTVSKFDSESSYFLSSSWNLVQVFAGSVALPSGQ